MPFFDDVYINYFKKNGVECGAEEHVGIEEHAVGPTASIAPNPSSGMITILSSGMIAEIEVTDVRGSVLRQHLSNSDHVVMDLSDLPQGIYCTRIELRDGSVIDQRIVLLR